MKNKIMKTTFAAAFLLLILALSFAGVRQANAENGSPLETSVSWHPQSGSGVVEGAYATLNTNKNGASYTFHASQLKPGNVYTLWFIVLNAPENCATSPCTHADLLGSTELVQSNVTYAGGHVAGASGQGTFAGHIAAGEMPDAWYDNDFSDPLGAEIHLVLNDHGPKITDLLSNMLHSYRGGCTDASLPPPFPASAKADGIPGPNTCRLYQTAIFQQ
jgi:hypothetical protein